MQQCDTGNLVEKASIIDLYFGRILGKKSEEEN